MSAEPVPMSGSAASGRKGATPLRQFLSFALVGGVGFAIDAGLFLFAHDYAGWSIAWSRTFSAAVALTATWILNRILTFSSRKSRDRAGEYVRYLVTQGLGLMVNLGVFAGSLLLFPPLRRVPIVALALGAAVALCVNFVTARTFAFRAESLPPR